MQKKPGACLGVYLVLGLSACPSTPSPFVIESYTGLSVVVPNKYSQIEGSLYINIILYNLGSCK